jgi:hypothetical protein
MECLDGNSDVLERLSVEMYARGLSVRDVEDCFRDATGALLISKTAVAEITDQLWDHYQMFCHRELSEFDVCYLFLDSILREPAPLRGQGGHPRGLRGHHRGAQGAAALRGWETRNPRRAGPSS